MYTSAIPSRSRCIELMDEVDMPVHIRRHSFAVATIALYLGCSLRGNGGSTFNLQLLEAAALLHDIAKPRSIVTGERHDELGAQMLDERGYFLIAPIVKEHVSMDWLRLNGPMTESLLVNYSDKRVKHDQIVSLEERFRDLLVRYGKTKEQRLWIEEKVELYRVLEERIFEALPIGPVDEELMSLRVNTAWEGEADGDKW